MTQPEVRKFTAPCVEKAQTDQGWKVTFNIPELSQFAYGVNRIPDADAAKLEVGKTYYISLIKGRLKDGKDAAKDYNYWWDWGGMAVEVLPETPKSPTSTSIPVSISTDAKADSIERQVALKVAGELYSNLCNSPLGENDWSQAHREALVLARRLVNYFFEDKS